ncbi:hypothetical protein AJ79_00276 [Helicocarpus griseus UAMH5409]|uniref:Uncharacterized protein n=1 Tax=Helicocarpus griseus UAMH5409 TaxID=1447875 RepID=A0A2B7YCU8_9EURO|nr:hypothetical protein AJ79_00276 [Helicocarpus griseus UAMH5409]
MHNNPPYPPLFDHDTESLLPHNHNHHDHHDDHLQQQQQQPLTKQEPYTPIPNPSKPTKTPSNPIDRHYTFILLAGCLLVAIACVVIGLSAALIRESARRPHYLKAAAMSNLAIATFQFCLFIGMCTIWFRPRSKQSPRPRLAATVVMVAMVLMWVAAVGVMMLAVCEGGWRGGGSGRRKGKGGKGRKKKVKVKGWRIAGGWESVAVACVVMGGIAM